MSHLSKIDIKIKSLSALKNACKRIGIKFIENKTRYRWYHGIANCEHVIEIPNAQYDVGVVKNGHEYMLMTDYWDPTIQKVLGTNCGKLKQLYSAEVIKETSYLNNYVYTENIVNNEIRIKLYEV